MSIHFVPRDDLIEHETSPICVCGPTVKEQRNYLTVSHRRLAVLGTREALAEFKGGSP